MSLRILIWGWKGNEAIRPAMLYGAECWPTKRRHVQQISVAKMRMLRWICDHRRRDRVRNDDIRDRLGVAPIEEKLVQHRLRWFGHVRRRPPEAPVRSGERQRKTEADLDRCNKRRLQMMEYIQRLCLR